MDDVFGAEVNERRAVDGQIELIGRSKIVFAMGIVSVEAEHFFKQTATKKRAFYLVTSKQIPEVNGTDVFVTYYRELI